MNFNKINTFFSFFLMLILFVSCNKQEGCTSNEAMNFNVEAEKDDGSCIYAYDIAQGMWNINPDCEELDVPGIGAISLNDQLPDSINVQGSGGNQLFIDIQGTPITATIENNGEINVNSQSVSIDFGLGLPFPIIIDGNGQIYNYNSGTMNLNYSVQIPLIGTQQTSCVISIYR